METTMKGNLYKSKLTGKVYFVLRVRENYRSITLKGTQPPFTVRGMSTRSLEQYHTPITKENQ
jgi:hypothetical protein